jgi:hypothetical protein
VKISLKAVLRKYAGSNTPAQLALGVQKPAGCYSKIGAAVEPVQMPFQKKFWAIAKGFNCIFLG